MKIKKVLTTSMLCALVCTALPVASTYADETEKVEAKLKEAEALLAKVTDTSLKATATETLAGLRNNLSLQTMDNNGIMAEAEKLLALLKR